MAKRKKKDQTEDAQTEAYTDAEGNILVLRQTLSGGTVKKVKKESGNAAASIDDVWRRREEMLFEHLAVSWEIAGLPLDDQAMLIGRYRMADPEMQAWVRETINAHLERFIPELADL